MVFCNKIIQKAILLCILGTAFFLYSPAPIEAGGAGNTTVFIYHRFADSKYPTTNVSLEKFQEQLTYLRDNEYRVISLDDMVAALAKGESLPDKSVVITIDDGYLSVYEKAWPILKSFGYPFTVFLCVKGLDKGHKDYMTWGQAREMQAAGVDFQYHGYGHYRMANRPAGMNHETYRAWIRSDLAIGHKIMTKNMGQQPRFFAVPYGEYNQTVIHEAKDLNYEAVLLQDPGSVSEDTSVYVIPREPILGDEWSTLEHFKTVLDRVDLPFTEMTPAPVPLADSIPTRFGARLLYPQRYKPGTLGIYVSELGWQPAQLEGDVVSIKNSTTLTRRLNRVAISAREKETGRIAIRFWLLVMEQDQATVSPDPSEMILKND